MNYSVIWLVDAEDELAAIWLDAADRDAITRAVFDLDRDLSTNPLDAGESRGRESERIVFFAPLAAIALVNEQDRTVSVEQVWRIGRGGT
jgi:hypothetical protein